MHNNNEREFKINHSPDPIKLVNFIKDRMHKFNDTKQQMEGINAVHMIACLFGNYLLSSPGINVPIEDVNRYFSQYSDAMNPDKPFD